MRPLARIFRRGRAQAMVAGRVGVVETATAKAGGPWRGVEAASERPDAVAWVRSVVSTLDHVFVVTITNIHQGLL